MGWLPAGPALVRLDVAERIAAELAYVTRRAPAPPPSDLASRLGVRADALGPVLTVLGFRLLEPAPLPDDVCGPPTPLRIAQIRLRGPSPDRRGGRPDRHEEGAGPSHRGARRGAPRPAGSGPPGARGGRDGRDRPRQGEGPDRPDRRPGAETAARERGGARPPRPADAAEAALVAAGQAGAPADAPARGPQRGDARADRSGREGREAWRRPPRQGEAGGQEQRGARSEGANAPRPGGREAAKGPNPDSPFAILAQLKLR
jgi:ATP-dependent RNA helicase SUPV3L1/SUV3